MKFKISQASDCWVDTVDKTVKEAFKEGADFFVEINSLEELISFQEKYGSIVIRDSLFLKDTKEIVLYNDYLES